MKIYNKILLLVACILITSFSWGQSTNNDLGIVWEKTYTSLGGQIFSMKPNYMDDNYIAAGQFITGKSAFILEIDELGNEIRSKTLALSTIYAPADASRATGLFNFALKTDDGGILAIGAIYDYNAPTTDKSTNWTGKPDSYNPNLNYGLWLVKFDKDLNVVKNERLRGTRPTDMYRLTNGNIFVGGVDAPATHGPGKNDYTTMLRVFDQNGNLVKDSRADKGAFTSLIQHPGTDDFVTSTPGSIMKISVTANTANITQITAVGSLALPQVVGPFIQSISSAEDGGLLLLARLKSDANSAINIANGYGLYKLNENYVVQFYEIMKPAYNLYYPPLLMSNNVYVGNYSSGGVTYMYQLIDDGTFNASVGVPYPTGTSLNLTSKSDGFFSVGTLNGYAKIAKLSTCVNFKTTSLPEPSITETIVKPYSPTINVSLPLNYTGNKGTVTYDLQAVVISGTVDGKYASDATGGVLYTKSNQAPESSSIAVTINDNWPLDTKYAVIEYRFTLHDAYKTGIVDQSCGQTYIFRVAIVPQTDVVAMPILVKDGTSNKVTATIKNIGAGDFENYKITIYDSTLGSTTNYTFTYNGSIASNETVRLDIDLASTPVASSSTLVVSFNDNGTGTANQISQTNKQFVYTIN